MARLSPADVTEWLTEHDPLAVVAWEDQVVERLGHAPRSVYVETYWLPVLGPSATWALRRLTSWLDAEPAGYEVSLSELGRELGLGAGTGRHAVVIRTLGRLVAFGMTMPRGDALAVRRMVGPLTQRQVHALPEALAARHDAESTAAMQPRPQRTVLSETAQRHEIAPAVGEVRPGETGNGAAVRSRKPTAAPPGPAAAADSRAAG